MGDGGNAAFRKLIIVDDQNISTGSSVLHDLKTSQLCTNQYYISSTFVFIRQVFGPRSILGSTPPLVQGV